MMEGLRAEHLLGLSWTAATAEFLLWFILTLRGGVRNYFAGMVEFDFGKVDASIAQGSWRQMVS
jgi:hypothetical protein